MARARGVLAGLMAVVCWITCLDPAYATENGGAKYRKEGDRTSVEVDITAASHPPGVYKLGPAFRVADINVDFGSTLSAELFACDLEDADANGNGTVDAEAGCVSLTAITADVALTDVRITRRYLILDVNTAEGASTVSRLTMFGSFTVGGSGGVVGSGTLAEMNAYPNPSAGDLWQQTDDDGTGDCATDGGTDSALLCQYDAATTAWVPAGIAGGTDNLGNHTATTDLDMADNSVIGVDVLSAKNVLGGHAVSQYASLQAAIDAACLDDNRLVWLDENVSVSTPVLIDSNGDQCNYLTIEGVGQNVTVTADAGITAFDVESDWITLRNFKITHASGNAANIGIRLADDTPSASGASNILIERMQIMGVGQNGIGIDAHALVSSQIRNSDIWTWDQGIVCDENGSGSFHCNAVELSGNRIRSNITNGINILYLTGQWSLFGNTIEGDQETGVRCDHAQGMIVAVGNHMEAGKTTGGTTGDVDFRRTDSAGGTGACGFILIGNRFGSTAEWNYLETYSSNTTTKGFGNYWTAGWSVTTASNRPEWYPQFNEAQMNLTGSFSADAESRGTNFISSDCSTEAALPMLRGDLCQNTGDGRLYYCATPDAGGRTGVCDVATELAAVPTPPAASSNYTWTGSHDFGGGTLEVPNSTSLPGTCAVGQIYMDTDATSGQRIYACESANTWKLQGDGGGGGGYTTVDDEDTPLTQRTTLNFEGAGVTCVDDTDQTTCTIPGGSAGTVDTANSPGANEFARFTDADTIEGRTVSETRSDLGLATDDDVVFNSVETADRTTEPGNLFSLNDNDTAFTNDPTCANSGTAGTLTIIDKDETATDDWVVCDGTTELGSLAGLGSGSSTLAGLTDTDITTPATGATLIWNGTDWVDGPLDLADADARTGVLPAANGGTGISALGTGVATALGVNVGSAGSFVTNGGALGTPSSGVLTNATGLPVSTGISGLGTGVAAALAVATGSNGAFVVRGGTLGTPSSGVLTNATGLPISTGLTGAGTGVQAALAVNTGSAGAFGVVSHRGNTASVDPANALASGSCNNTDIAVSGVVTTDVILWSFDGPVDGVVGFNAASTSGSANIQVYPVADAIRVRTCNPTSGSLDPGAFTINWRVIR